MKFNSGQEMLDAINQDIDLYSVEKELYVFNYNINGNIAVYHISNEDADKLAKEDEYWGAYLGVGGYVYEDITDDGYEQGNYTNLDWCNDNYKGEWKDVSK